MSATCFSFPGHDHTTGELLCDYLNRDKRVRAAGYVIRNATMELQVDADSPLVCIGDANAAIIRDLAALRRSVIS